MLIDSKVSMDEKAKQEPNMPGILEDTKKIEGPLLFSFQTTVFLKNILKQPIITQLKESKAGFVYCQLTPSV